MPCQPGAVTPEPGSVVTVSPSAETVPVPLMTSWPVVWSKLRMSSVVPGAALNTFGMVSVAGVANTALPGAWMVMSKVCWRSPCGSMSMTICAGTALMPTCAFCAGLPLASTRLPGMTINDSSLICCCVSAEPASFALAGAVRWRRTARRRQCWRPWPEWHWRQ
jgi:hypothetical protein